MTTKTSIPSGHQTLWRHYDFTIVIIITDVPGFVFSALFQLVVLLKFNVQVKAPMVELNTRLLPLLDKMGLYFYIYVIDWYWSSSFFPACIQARY
jgi:hypothetical protein